jgi:uncharacterized membrane protein YheB (UPF0754 family)
MLFHPYKPVKVFGITIWPQGMIPRHRDKLAQSIGNAVGNELVSQQTVFDALFETSFFQDKVEDFVGSYTNDLLSRVYPSFIDALPSQARAPILDTISALQYRLAEYIAEMLKSDETSEAIEHFVDKQVDELLERRVGDMVKEKSFDRVLDFVENRVHRFTATDDFDKDRIDQQVPPIVHHLADIATSQSTSKRIGGLIKLEVDQYYEQLSLFKKIFISRERIHREVDELVNKTLPKRVEEYLRGPAFEQEAEEFLNATVDNVMSRPLDELIGQFDPIRFEDLKSQISNRLIELLRSEALTTSLSMQVTDAFDRLRPQKLGEVMQQLDSNSRAHVKNFLSKSLLSLLSRDDTARTINAIMTAQIERLLIQPIGRLGDHVSRGAMERASSALVERITLAARERLPVAIAEFDVGGLVRKKVSDYPLEKLEELVLSVAQHHLKTIELFGAIIGFFIGVAQAIYFWFTYHR